MTNTSNNELQVPAPTADWQEEDWTKFRDWIVGMLRVGPMTVTFTKKDGSERVMNCTLEADVLPPQPVHESNTNNPIDFPKVKKENPNIISAYDLDALGWRSFTLKSVKQVRIDI